MWILNTTLTDYHQWAWKPLSLAAPGYEPIPLAGSGLSFIKTIGSLTSVGGTTNGSRSVPNLYRFHALGLLPPVQVNQPDVPKGWDFDLASSTTSVFSGSSPSFDVLARDSDDKVFTTSFGHFTEVTPSGKQVTSFDISQKNGFILMYNVYDPALGYKVTVFTRHAVPGSGKGTSLDAVSVRFEFYQYTNNTHVDVLPPDSTLNPLQFLVAGGVLKFNVRVANWPFESFQNSLVVNLGFNFPAEVSLTSTAESYGTAYKLTCEKKTVNLDVLRESVNDILDYKPVHTDITADKDQVSVQFTFASFKKDLYYDPSLGTLLVPAGDGTDNTPIYIGVFVSVGAVLILAVIALIIGFIVMWYNRRKLTGRFRTMTFVQGETLSSADIPD